LLIGISVKAQAIKEVSIDWTSFVRSIELKSKSQKKFGVDAYVKLEVEDKLALAGVWARVDSKNDKNGFW
jgi:hypothetical protein